MTVKLLYLVSHAIQYQAPLLQRIAKMAGVSLRVVFENDSSPAPLYDPGFEREIQWDIPLRDGYDNISLAETGLEREINDCDILWLHGWQTPVMRRALRHASRAGRPVLMRAENNDLAMPDGPGLRGFIKRRYLHSVFLRCSAFLTIGSANEKYYLARGISPERLFPTPYAIDNERFGMAAENRRAERRDYKISLGLDPDRPVLLYAGKLLRRKRPDLLAKAFQRADFGPLPPQLVFVGDGEMLESLRALAPQAAFLGFRNQRELPALYDMAELFVLPSVREPWGLAVNEAMACSTAVVVSDQVGCAADLVGPDCGVVFAAGDADSLARALVHGLKNAGAMGRAARSRIDNWGFDQDLTGLGAAIEYLTGGGNG